MKKLHILKIGGKVIDQDDELELVLKKFAKQKGPKILVHGGGSKASFLSQQLNLPVKMIDGRRITDKATLDVVTMVYAGLINKKIVSQLQKLKSNALGLSGADLNVIKAKKRVHHKHDFGFVGDIEKIDTKTLKLLLKNKIIPVFCAISHDQDGQLLNTNADTIASNLAIALSPFFKVKLVFHFDKKGVLEDPADDNSLIKKINPKQYQQYKAEGIIQNGMIPKIDNAYHALNHQVKQVFIKGSHSKGTKICL